MDIEFKLSLTGYLIFTLYPEPGRVYRVIGIDKAMEQAELTRRWLLTQQDSNSQPENS